MLGRNEIMVIKPEVQKNLFFYFTPVLIKNFIVCFFRRRCIYTTGIYLTEITPYLLLVHLSCSPRQTHRLAAKTSYKKSTSYQYIIYLLHMKYMEYM